MKSRLLITLLLLVLPTLAASVWASSTGKGRPVISRCTGPGCEAVATEKSWPAMISQEDGVAVVFRGITFRLPDELVSVGIGDGVNVFRLKNEQLLLVSKESFEGLNLPRKGLSVSEAADVLFTKVPKDPEPADKERRKSWRLMLSMKRGLFHKNPRLTVYRKGPITVYRIAGGGGPYKNVALVSNAKSENYLMRLESNIETGRFVEIIATISAKGE